MGRRQPHQHRLQVGNLRAMQARLTSLHQALQQALAQRQQVQLQRLPARQMHQQVLANQRRLLHRRPLIRTVASNQLMPKPFQKSRPISIAITSLMRRMQARPIY